MVEERSETKNPYNPCDPVDEFFDWLPAVIHLRDPARELFADDTIALLRQSAKTVWLRYSRPRVTCENAIFQQLTPYGSPQYTFRRLVDRQHEGIMQYRPMKVSGATTIAVEKAA